jgi:hypothetical protein
MRTPFAVVLLIFAAGLPHHPSGLSPQAPAERPPVVGLRLRIDGGAPSRIRIPAGQQATAGLVGKGAVGMTPFVRESWIELVVVRLPEAGEAEPGEELARLELRQGEIAQVDAGFMRLEIEWIELLPRTTDGADETTQGPCVICCVGCEGEWTCSCRVETPCGGCCCPNACACPGATTAGSDPGVPWQAGLPPTSLCAAASGG